MNTGNTDNFLFSEGTPTKALYRADIYLIIWNGIITGKIALTWKNYDKTLNITLIFILVLLYELTE